MQKTFELTIDRPLEDVWRHFSNQELLSQWQPNLKSYQHQSGKPGQVGAVSQLKFVEMGQEIKLRETILEIIPMSKFAAVYHSRLSHSIIKHQFHELAPSQTRWIVFIQFTWEGLLGKMLGPLATSTIEHRFSHDFQMFKQLVEKLA